ncbi:nucleotidyltransferase family protein [Sphingomonas nostoxanthinifaciens]|uniref:nucleotidyltransferase family protein n=1 Tax=Sphingomonas nostoxanthinifaciens TaxID=2872652 RepID=UPI001CC2175D|nr:nucleotidyltransferase family protein [Sphingomonas nostoxanthinifaciens]UAK23218.1 nucleotidyltransferase family protein [Sphingomonas nostoxanthinifaciens]
MIPPEAIAVVLLAAGSSSRFGTADKLAQTLDGLPLGLHAARTLSRLPFAARIAVTRPDGPDFRSQEFAPVINPDPDAGQSGSIRLGLAAARLAEPRAVLIALADMPFVTIAHIAALMVQFDSDAGVVASSDGGRALPPALFDATHFPALETLTGDAGARALLREATLVAAPPAELRDIDTIEDLHAARTR